MKEEQIDKYILNKMSPQERVSFENELVENAELQKEVELQRDIIRAIRLKAAKEHLQKVEAAHHVSKSKHIPFSMVFRLTSIVAVAACCAIGLFVNYNNTTEYKVYGQSIDLAQYHSRGDTNEINQVIDAIQNEKYTVALSLINEIENKPAFIEDSLHPDIREQLLIEQRIQQDDLNYLQDLIQTE